LAIGVNSAIFSVVNGVLLKPLPYPRPERLVFITSQFPTLGFDQFWVSAPEFVEFRERNKSFADVGAYRAGAVNLGTADQPRRVNSAIVTSELMPVLGVAPIRGRQFTREDTLPGAEDVAVLSMEIWQTAFASDESVMGRVVRIDGVPTRIVGIMPAGYDIHDAKVQVWLPLTLDPANPGNRGGHFLYLVGRLRDDVSMTQAAADVERMLVQWNELNPKTHTPDPKNHRLRLDGLQEDLVGGIATALWVLQGAVAFVLLIACANLANLLLARAESRQKEFAIRSALGAGRIRLLRQFLTEGMLLALMGGTVGVALGVAGLRAMLAANPESLPRAANVVLDPVVLLFTLMVSVVTGALFGMAPLLHLRERTVTLSLKEAGQRSTANAARARLRSGLVMGEVALAVVLVVGAGLLLRSFWNLMKVDAGFNRSRLTTFGLVLPSASYQEPQSRSAAAGARGAGCGRNDGPSPDAPGECQRYGLRGLQPAAATAAVRERRLLSDRHAGVPHDDGDSSPRGQGLHAVRYDGLAGRDGERDAGEDLLQGSESDRQATARGVQSTQSLVDYRRRRA
jgi:putative ABC transport system permease protein